MLHFLRYCATHPGIPKYDASLGAGTRKPTHTTRGQRLLAWAALLTLAISIFAPSPAGAQVNQEVILADVDGIIDPAVAEYVESSISAAERENAEALLIRLDTPGGLDTSMRSIVKSILNSRVPVIVYVAPPGARAASAGTFITMAAHLAAMAPGTNIGAAHPVTLFGELPEEAEQKAVNDAVAYIRGIARQTGRNQDWAEDAVRNSVSISAERALELHVIDYVAQDVEALLDSTDGNEVTTEAGTTTLNTAQAETTERPMSFRLRALHILADPNVAYLLLIIGLYGLIYEFASPGLGLAGIGGAISIILGLYSLQVLPVNYAGLVLIVLGIALLIAEAVNPGFGMLGIGGIAAMTIGSFVLFESPLPDLRVSPLVILPTVGVTAALILFAVRMAVRAQRQRPATGAEGMIGEIGEVTAILDPSGEVFVHGERWRAESVEGTIDKGEAVEVVEVKGLKLMVKRPMQGEAAVEGRG